MTTYRRPMTDAAVELDLAARSRVNVMITAAHPAERATWARIIHGCGPSCGGPLVAVCGLSDPGGTHTADQMDRWFVRAAGGALFIDQVGALSLHAQARLLALLTARSGEGVRSDGDDWPVRIIAGTDRPLRAALVLGRFDEALFYRLNVIQIDETSRLRRGEGSAPVSDTWQPAGVFMRRRERG